ncbi:hypothetical protein HPO96_09540 [Kribbella sandramycini]|uniref:Imm-5-like domain-containing protein n=1 Tax=Kribbella sandramycini TaxID=60450 RepID=A0A7Y4KZF4_9ACTN|nr:hypothetical protein [Kribbella sandramycini]MBB6569682.1 hypothetical protein [Kribbella sandramycini]NOL40486.1 hypothetical protein [Kribbella sandramycini]
MTIDIADHHAIALWAAVCAEHVLENFERAAPDDPRPREAIEAGRAWVRGELKMVDARKFAFASHAAARDAPDAAATAAARAAGHAAATAHVYTHAPHAAKYAAASAGKAIELRPTPTDIPRTAIAREREWQLGQVPEHLRTMAFPPHGTP